MNDVSKVINDVVNVASQVAPQAPIVEAAEAAIATVASPTPVNYLADIQLAISIISTIKQHLDGKHPSLWGALKGLF